MPQSKPTPDDQTIRTLKEEIRTYEDIQTGWDEKHRVLILGLTVAQSPAARNKHLGNVNPDYRLAMLDMTSLAEKFPGRTHQEFFLYKNGEFTDKTWVNYRHLDENGVPLANLTPEQTDIDPIPIPQQAKDRVAAFLRTAEHDDLTIYILVANVQNDPHQRVGGAFGAAPLARLLRDLDALTGERFKRVQINLLACAVGYNPYKNRQGESIPGKVAEDFANAVLKLTGDRSDQEADGIVQALKAEDDAALANLRPPPGLKLQVRAPNYVVYLHKTGHKLYMMVRDNKRLIMKSQMTSEQRGDYKSVHHLLPDGTLLKLPPGRRALKDKLDQLTRPAQLKLRLFTRWGVAPADVLLGTTKASLFRRAQPGAAEVVGLEDTARHVVRTTGDFGAPLRDGLNRVEVRRLHAKHFPPGAGGVGQHFTFAPDNDKKMTLTLHGEPIAPAAIEDTIDQAPLEERLARRLKTGPDLIDLVDLSDGLDELIRTSDESKDEYPPTLGRCSLRVAHYDADADKVYLLQMMPPTHPEKRVYAVDRKLLLAAEAETPHENQLFTFSAINLGAPGPIFSTEPTEPTGPPDPLAVGKEHKEWAEIRAMLPAKLGREWEELKQTVPAAIAALTEWRGYLNADERRARAAPWREMIDASLAEMTTHQATLAQPFDQDALWRIKKALRREAARYASREWRAAVPDLAPREETVLTLSPAFDERIARFEAGELQDEDLRELQAIARREDMDVPRYVLALAGRGALTWLGADAESLRPKRNAAFWASLPRPGDTRDEPLPGLVEATLRRDDGGPSAFTLLLNVNDRGEIQRAHAPIWDEPERNRLFGVLERPARVAPGLIKDGALPLDPAMTIVPYGQNATLPAAQINALKAGETLAFVIDKRGSLRIGANDVALAAGEPARIGGELAYDPEKQRFFITNRSQYANHRSRTSMDLLSAVLPFLHQNAFKTEWRRHDREKNWFAQQPSKNGYRFITVFNPETLPENQAAVFAGVSPNPLARRLDRADVRAAYEAGKNNALFSDGGAQYRRCLDAALRHLDVKTFREYVETLHRGRALLTSDRSMDDETRRRLLEETTEKLSLAAAHYIETIHAQIPPLEAPQKIETWTALANAFAATQTTEAAHQQAIAAIANDFAALTADDLRSAALTDIPHLAAAFAANQDENRLDAMGRIAAHLASTETGFAGLDDAALANLIVALQGFAALDKQHAYPFAAAIDKLETGDAQRKVPERLGQLRNLPQAERAAKLDNFIKAEQSIAARLVEAALRQHLIAGDEAHRWAAQLAADPQWNGLLAKRAEYQAPIDAAVAAIEEKFRALLDQPPAIAAKKANKYGELIKKSLPEKAKPKDKNKAEQEWRKIVENKDKSIPTEHLSYLKAIRDYFADHKPAPGTFKEQETKARAEVEKMKPEAETSARVAATKAYMTQLSPPAIAETPQPARDDSVRDAAPQSVTNAEPSAEGAETSSNAAKKKKKKSKPKQPPREPAPAQEEAHAVELAHAFTQWMENQPVPEALFVVNEENKHRLADSLMDAPTWDEFLLREYREGIEKATRMQDRALARLNCSLATGQLPDVDRTFYSDKIRFNATREKVWLADQMGLLRWEGLNGPSCLPREYHDCFTEVMNYLRRAKSDFQGDVEDCRQLALEDISAAKEEEQRREKRELTLKRLDQLLAAKQRQLSQAASQFSDKEVAELCGAMKKKLKKGQNPLSPALAKKIADMSFEKLQEDLLQNAAMNAFLDEHIKDLADHKKREPLRKEKESREEKLRMLQHELDDHAFLNLTSLIRAYYLKCGSDLNAPVPTRDDIEANWNGNVRRDLTQDYGENAFSCLTQIRDHFLSRPNDLPFYLEDAREQAIKELEAEALKAQPEALEEQEKFRAFEYEIKSDYLRAFVSRIYPDKQWGDSIPLAPSSKKSAVDDSQRKFGKEESSPPQKKQAAPPIKGDSSEKKKESLPPAFADKIIQTLRNNDSPLPLLENALKTCSKEEALEFLLSKESWITFTNEIIALQKPEATKKCRELEHMTTYLEHVTKKSREAFSKTVDLFDAVGANHVYMDSELELTRYMREIEELKREARAELTVECLPLLQSEKNLRKEVATLDGLAEKVIAAARAKDYVNAKALIKDAIEQTSLDKARAAISSASAWKQFLLESEQEPASDKRLEERSEEYLERWFLPARLESELKRQKTRILNLVAIGAEIHVLEALANCMDHKTVEYLAELAQLLDVNESWRNFVSQDGAAVFSKETQQSIKGLLKTPNELSPDIFNSAELPLGEATRNYFCEVVKVRETLDKGNAMCDAIADAMGLQGVAQVTMAVAPNAQITTQLIVKVFSELKPQLALPPNADMTAGSSSYRIVDENGKFDEKAVNTGLRKHLREMLKTPGATARGELNDAVILTNLPAPERCAAVSKDRGGKLWIKTTEGPQDLEDYFKQKIAVGKGRQLRNIELVYVKGSLAQITAANTKQTAQRATESAKSKMSGKKKI